MLEGLKRRDRLIALQVASCVAHARATIIAPSISVAYIHAITH